MACPPIITGDEFLERTLTHIDCQAQLIGSYGFQALGQPGSTASLVLSGMLALFIALFGVRLLFGPQPAARDVVFDVIKIGIVLTLALSWPAFRTVVYDVTLKAPAEVASVIQTSSGNGGPQGFTQRLEAADNSLVALTTIGTGRNVAALVGGDEAGSTFRSAAIEDDTGFGSARVLYLASVIGTLGILRIGAGLLLAVAPLVAGLFFFSQTRGIFAGWIKGLVFTIAGSVGVTIVLTVQLAILEPWLADALEVRDLGYATPAAPTEILAIMLAFLLVKIGVIWLLAKVTFYRGWLTLPDAPALRGGWNNAAPAAGSQQSPRDTGMIRAERISTFIENSVRREQLISNERLTRASDDRSASQGAAQPISTNPPRLGSSFRRTNQRTSRAARLRDQQS
ncbi:type IV secretion system protein [Erythrobacter sp. SCSIO 43205]|uniref:type IV secretion system protein n=1 Tax=Erythrobacter sp. SCSIO 43205 TaxID=2779361 RepID=UPI001CA7E4B1|nr:type IV secretion system protein [Erythrobacter sp. SCSIO 43205]UAB79222.1 type IV secretion system protein [Erythrobacter sp. SCSIO 43205]